MKKEISPLAAPMVNGARWLNEFNKQTYESSFTAYCGLHRHTIVQALENSTPQALAETIYRELEAYWHAKRWGRRSAVTEGRMLATMFFTPMLLEMGEEASALALALQQCWAAHGMPYTLSTKEHLCKSFARNFCGFPLKENGDGIKIFRF
ncbi:MAG: hypothetical protein IKV99_09305 [Oscillospiraceae bacterium]|nr:hypothetical protein [Oscillospiraceae bacterium]